MFKLRISNTRFKLAIAFLLSGPGIAVWTYGRVGSLGIKGCSYDVFGVSGVAAAAAVAADFVVDEMHRRS